MMKTMRRKKPVSISRMILYLTLGLFALFFLLPFVVMLLNSMRPLSEIRSGNLMALPKQIVFEPWSKAWESAQVGVNATGLRPFFWNSIKMVIPAVSLSVAFGAINGYVLAHWRFKGDNIVFLMILFSCFIPFQVVLIPMARVLGMLQLAGSVPGLVLVHVVYGIGFTTLFFRNAYIAFPRELLDSGMVDGAGFFRIFLFLIVPNSLPIIMVSVIWQFTNIWNDFLFGVSFAGAQSQPVTVALNNLVQSSTGVKEYNVHFAGAIMAALPTLLVYVLSGRYFLRGLMSGAVKG